MNLDNIVLAEVMIARQFHDENLAIYVALRQLYKSAHDMDKDRDMIINTICKGYGDVVYTIVERHRNKNNMLSKRKIQKRNKNMSKQEVFDALLDEKVYCSIMQCCTEKYVYIRKYAFIYHTMCDSEFTQVFMDEFMETFISEL